MATSPNRLLRTLSALGLIAGTSAAVIAPVAYTMVQGAELSAEIEADLQAKIAFIQAYPQSAVAQTLLSSLVALLSSLDATTRAAALEQISSWGGLPPNVPGIKETPFAAVDVAAAFGAIATGATGAPATSAAVVAASSIY